VLEHGLEWGLVSGPADEAAAVLRRGARAILPHFALMEQWRPDYVATSAARSQFESRLAYLVGALCPAIEAHESRLLLPATMDALVLIYADMTGSCDALFERRWRDIERRARVDDPAIASILPVVKPRIQAACNLVERFLTSGTLSSAAARRR
jgi:hypothetical protein